VKAGRLLFDENLSPRLPTALSDAFPGSTHVRVVGLKGASDQTIWEFALKAGFTIVTKDDDFKSLSLLRGAPPKVVWLLVGNMSTAEIQQCLLRYFSTIESFIAEPTTSLLILRKS
jgi:predicted nuclease of predicted toxin-antitoxin system